MQTIDKGTALSFNGITHTYTKDGVYTATLTLVNLETYTVYEASV
ncbi:hypothetical protein [Nostoc sp.]